MRSFLSTNLASAALHAGVVGAFVALSSAGILAPPESAEVGIQIVREAGDPEMRVQPPRPEVEFERLECRVELDHPVPDESLVERPRPEIDIRDERLVPRPVPPPPLLDRPVRPVSQKISPAPSASESAPSEISNPPPEYPALARRRGYEGSVVLSFQVLADGSCGDVRVTEPSGHDILDEAAARAVRFWRFRPATRDGQPVVAVQRIRFTFKLQG